MYFEKICLDLEEEKEVWDAIKMLKIISARTTDKEEKLRTCFIECQKVFDRVNWTRLLQILTLR